MNEVRFFVSGVPAPGGSKQAFVPLHPVTKQPYRSKKTGRIVVNVIDDAGKRNKDWRGNVAVAAMASMKAHDLAPLTGPLEMELLFRMPRPKYHYRSDGIALKPGAPQYHDTRPDATKLTRSTEDALTGKCWVDDGQIVKQTVEKAYSDQPGCWVIVREAAR